MELLLNLLKNKEKLIAFLLETIRESDKHTQGILKFSESLTRENQNISPENLARCLATVMKIQAKQSATMQSLAMIALIVCQGSSFDTNVAQMLNKLGKGEEALQQLFKNKQDGK